MKALRIIKIVAVNLAVFTVLLIVVNWACGIYLERASRSNRSELPNYNNDPEYARAVFADYHRIKHRYEPFVGWRALPYAGKTTHISDHGLRTHNISPSRDSSRQVVRFFGGSTMWGEGSDDEHTIPAIFNSLNPQYQVFNHGQLAYNTRQELDELISVYARDERVDITIFYDGVNDAAFLCPREIDELPAHRLVPMYRQQLYRGRKAIVREFLSKLFVEDIVAAAQHLSQDKNPPPEDSPYDCVLNPEKAEAIAEMMIKNWELAHEIVTRRGGVFYAFLQPAAYVSRPRVEHLDLDNELGNNFRKVYWLLQEKIKLRAHPWIIDLSQAFDNSEYIFIDFCHVSPNGNEIIARKVSETVHK